jgi:hypothetical protein
MRWKLVILLVAVSVGFGDESRYSGPLFMGPVRIDHPISVRPLLAQLGQPNLANASAYCFESQDRGVFVWLEVMAHDEAVVGDALISSFPNCVDRVPHIARRDSLQWKAERGIGIGSTEREVVAAYGRPSREDRIIGNAYRWVVHGGMPLAEKIPNRGSRVLVYRGASDDIRTAEFGLSDGRVAWIFVSCNE